ncbi:hypothetical protein C9374_001344 [Naegleria lovaniensis]|uniref:F-box domain-containing protein n=1 Tax=Naegleria lovaniensis TaxID=51637 RepID=A0AA88GVM2_NAELO|nr:uncharacterized protein C9374_001344 [Naegleria lovaniensis]KAG2387750.1 hypothetical protein C9374_001344 [Naegleria lovaniensis]
MRFFSSKISRHHGDAQDDLDALSNTSRPNFILNFIEIPSEILLHIAEFMELKSLFAFAKCHSSLLMLLFNQEKHKKIGNKDPQSDEDIGFVLVQFTIWKPLVCYYFPKFEKSLNVKNWMHVLRRRIEHLKLHSPNMLPLQPNNASSSAFQIKETPVMNYEENFIENCEWIYKCPLSFDELGSSSFESHFCATCEKTVYLVRTVSEFQSRVSNGDCIAFTTRAKKNTKLRGKVAYFPTPVR